MVVHTELDEHDGPKQQINVRMNAEEIDRLGRVAKHYGVSGASALRMLLKREDDALTKKRARK
jgi:hypothetical protein